MLTLHHRPDKFFDDIVLTNDEARFWLESRLAVIRKLQILKGYLGLTPKIWLLTGLYHMQDAVTFTTHGKSSLGGFSTSVPLPEPTGLASLLQLKIGSNAKFGQDAVVQRGTQISGKKVWAALWQQIGAKYTSVGGWEENMGVRQLKLLDVYSWQTVRAEKKEQAVAEVTLSDNGDVETAEAIGPDPGNEYWELFDKEVTKIEADYRE